MSCYHIKYFLQKYTTHQFTYFRYLLFEDKFKNPKIIKIQEVHQKLHTKSSFIVIFKLFTIGDLFEFNAT